MRLKHIVGTQMIVVEVTRLRSVEDSKSPQEDDGSLPISFSPISEVRKPKVGRTRWSHVEMDFKAIPRLHETSCHDV